MINLAGNKDADTHIYEELYLAGIEAIKETSNGEVPYTVIGRIGYWKLRRAWYYWVATVEYRKDGLPLDVAMKLHNTPHPTMTIMGNTIRSGGHCGCPSPDEYGAFKLNNEGKRYVDCYHIDDQIGLCEFAKLIKNLYVIC
jgi:hypothetical protein